MHVVFVLFYTVSSDLDFVDFVLADQCRAAFGIGIPHIRLYFACLIGDQIVASTTKKIKKIIHLKKNRQRALICWYLLFHFENEIRATSDGNTVIFLIDWLEFLILWYGLIQFLEVTLTGEIWKKRRNPKKSEKNLK